MEASASSGRQLIEAFRAGQLEAGDLLLRRYEPWLRLLARTQLESRFQSKLDPSDLVQQTMVAAVRALPGFRGTSEGEWAAWLRGILGHVLAHEVRRYGGTLKRDVGREVSMDEDLTAVSGRLGDLLAASGASPSQEAVRRDRELRLAGALERLPEDYRQVLVLRHLEGFSHEEVARRMGRNPGAVRMLWVRALARLRSEMEAAGFSAG